MGTGRVAQSTIEHHRLSILTIERNARSIVAQSLACHVFADGAHQDGALAAESQEAADLPRVGPAFSARWRGRKPATLVSEHVRCIKK